MDVRKMSFTALKNSFGTTMDSLKFEGDVAVVTKYGLPSFVLIPVDELESRGSISYEDVREIVEV